MGEIKRFKVVPIPLAEVWIEKAKQEVVKKNGNLIILESAAEENKEYIESLKKKGGKRDEFISREI